MKKCNCNLIICYDCWREHPGAVTQKCFYCKAQIVMGLPQKDIENCNKRDEQYGLFECVPCKGKIKRIDYISHFEKNHCHINCKMFETKCGKFTSCKINKHLRECKDCFSTICENCYDSRVDHPQENCLCGEKITICKKTKKFITHVCNEVEVNNDELYNKKCRVCLEQVKPDYGRHNQDCEKIKFILDVLSREKQIRENYNKLYDFVDKLDRKRKLDEN